MVANGPQFAELLAMAGVFHGTGVGLTKLQALVWFWLVPDSMSLHEI